MEHDPLHLRDLDPADLAPAIDDVRLISGKIVECECADGASAMDLHKVPWLAPEGGGDPASGLGQPGSRWRHCRDWLSVPGPAGLACVPLDLVDVQCLRFELPTLPAAVFPT